MLYDTSNPLQAEQFKLKAARLAGSGKVVELTEKKPKRSMSQNNYLHLILGYFAAQSGNTLEYVKLYYFKCLCNKDIFYRQKNDKYFGDTWILRSSANLDTGEMTTAIERFRNWSANEAGIYLPSPEDEKMLEMAEIEIERNKNYI
jgi:hypothetical protein